MGADHAFRGVQQFNGFSVQWEGGLPSVKHKLNGIFIQQQGQHFNERCVLCQDVFVAEIKLVQNDLVDVVVAEKIKQVGGVLDVLNQDGDGLDYLSGDGRTAATRYRQHLGKEKQHVLFTKVVEDLVCLTLVAVDDDFGNCAQYLDGLCSFGDIDRLHFGQDSV